MLLTPLCEAREGPPVGELTLSHPHPTKMGFGNGSKECPPWASPSQCPECKGKVATHQALPYVGWVTSPRP